MSYIVVLSVINSNNACSYALFNEKTLNRESVNSIIALSDLGTLTISHGYKPLNFSVDRNGQVKDDSGSFSRFHKDGVAIILAEIQNMSGRVLGYKLVSSLSGAVNNLKTDEIVKKEKALGRPFLQNGIVRNNTVNCFPLHKYPKILTDTRKVKQPSEKVQEKPRVEKPRVKNETLEFTKEQIAEINKCRNKGVDSRFIENPKLSVEQMRVLWVSKSKGALSEYFARPDYSVDVMKFYADRLYSKKIVQECSLMMHKPNLSVAQLSELYLCVCDGVNYSDLCDLSASDIEVKRRERTLFSDSTSMSSDEAFDKAMGVAMKMKGYF